jgi:hypothetical protein
MIDNGLTEGQESHEVLGLLTNFAIYVLNVPTVVEQDHFNRIITLHAHCIVE